ncbi:hypothetical protein [Gorillibacterium sp. CAU 1737]|uniref:hypothetical protein n=1 Tax=Gorillibacterium sp. CAU 1737 TaxID=3140362 RepID=UPI003260A4BC
MGSGTLILDSAMVAKYNVFLGEPAGEGHLYSFSELTEMEGARRFAKEYAPLIPSRTLDVAGTYWASWLSRLCGALQEMLLMQNAILISSLESFVLRLSVEDGYPKIAFYLKGSEVPLLPEGEERPAAAKQAMDRFYGEVIRPLLEASAKATEIPVRTLWAVLSTNLRYGQDQLEGRELPEAIRERFEHDFGYVMKGMPGAVAGLTRNPFDLKFRYAESPYKPGERVLIRSTCCLAYKTDTDYGYCYNCPKLSTAERQAKFQEIQQKLAAAHV